MPDSTLIIQALKQSLRHQGITYAELARRLNLSEATIKRNFARHQFTLERVGQICELLGMAWMDLLQIAASHENRLDHLSQQQEQEIASDRTLLLVTVCVLNHWKLTDICHHYQLTKPDCIHYLIRLERLGIIHLLPENRIKLLISEDFKWIKNGPIQAFFQAKIQQEFFSSQFNRPDECLLVTNGMLSDDANADFQLELEELVRKFVQSSQDQAHRPIGQRHGCSLVIALRPWEFGIFDDLRKKNQGMES